MADEVQSSRCADKTSGEIRLDYSLSGRGQEFAEALEDRGNILASLTEKEEAWPIMSDSPATKPKK